MAQNVANFFGNFFNNLWESFKKFLVEIGKFFSELSQNLSTLFTNITQSIGNWFSDLFTKLSEFFSNLSINLGNFFENLWNNIYEFFKDLPGNILKIFEWLGNFFTELYDFFIHLVIPTEEQQQALIDENLKTKDVLASKFPFISDFNEFLSNASSYSSNNNFLDITFKPWDLNFGIIDVKTPEIDFSWVSEAYEPYRETVRSAIYYIGLALAIVYVIKYFLSYGVTGSDANTVAKMTKGDDN